MNRGLKLRFLSDFSHREAYNTCVETTKVQRFKDTKNVQIEHRKKVSMIQFSKKKSGLLFSVFLCVFCFFVLFFYAILEKVPKHLAK